MLEAYFWAVGKNCKIHFPGNGCNLPLIPGHYMAPYHSLTQYYDLPINFNVGEALHSFNGQYKIKISILADENKDKEICWEWKVKLKFDDS